MNQKPDTRYEYIKDRYGGVVLRDSETGTEIYLHPGDDANSFIEIAESLREDLLPGFLSQWF